MLWGWVSLSSWTASLPGFRVNFIPVAILTIPSRPTLHPNPTTTITLRSPSLATTRPTTSSALTPPAPLPINPSYRYFMMLA